MLQSFFRSPLAVFIVVSIVSRFEPEHDQSEPVRLQIDLFAHPGRLASALDVDPVVRETRIDIARRPYLQPLAIEQRPLGYGLAAERRDIGKPDLFAVG